MSVFKIAKRAYVNNNLKCELPEQRVEIHEISTCILNNWENTNVLFFYNVRLM